nr:leucine-rich repeat protein [Tanacetum cinerariifolium]
FGAAFFEGLHSVCSSFWPSFESPTCAAAYGMSAFFSQCNTCRAYVTVRIGNQLTGPIPSSIGALNFLSHLNLSHNNLSGQIPTGSQLQTLMDPSIYVGNRDLCGAPLPKNCSNNEDQTTMHKNSKAANHKANKIWFYMDIMCGFAAGFWGDIGVLLFKKHWRHKLFMFAEEIVDEIYVALGLRFNKMNRGRESA